jgi:acyl-CoA synthetase (AMP-forming)/AMP-acid ligase II
VTFRELTRRAAGGAEWLGKLGLRRGQTVLVFQPVSIELYEFLLAAFHAGLRVMLADPSAGRGFLTDCCRRLRPDAFFGSWRAQCLRLSVPALRAIPLAIRSGAWFPGTRRWQPRESDDSPVELPDAEPALLTFTSGSTGMAKAAVRTHGFLLAQHQAVAAALDYQDGEVDLITLPVFVLANLASGLTSVLAATNLARPDRPDAAAIGAQCRRHRVTRCTASPAFFDGLLAASCGIPPLGKIFTGGAPVFPDLLRRLQAALPAAAIHAVYGSTEAEPIAHLRAGELDAAALNLTKSGTGLCAGRWTSEIRLAIIRDQAGEPLGPLSPAEWEQRKVPPGNPGEIVVTGAHVLRGYLDGVGDEETKVHVGDTIWHRTGDAGWCDAAGRLWLLGRCAAKLPPHPGPADLPPGVLDYPFAIECALREVHPGIRTAALAWQGKRTLAVGGGSDPTARAAIERSAAGLGIERIVHLASLPLDRRHRAKIDYPALLHLFASK